MDAPFRTDHLVGDLERRSIRAGGITIAAQVVKPVIQIGSTMALARLLAPADFGLIAMVTANWRLYGGELKRIPGMSRNGGQVDSIGLEG